MKKHITMTRRALYLWRRLGALADLDLADQVAMLVGLVFALCGLGVVVQLLCSPQFWAEPLPGLFAMGVIAGAVPVVWSLAAPWRRSQ